MSLVLGGTAHKDELRLEVRRLLERSDVAPALRKSLEWALSQRGRALSLESEDSWGILPLLVCEACGGNWRMATPAAAAISLWMAAGDVFDDLEDRDIPGLWEVEGDGPAVNAGTGLLFLSQAAALRLQDIGLGETVALAVLKELSYAGLRSCSGQHIDLTSQPACGTGLESYFHMTGLRSGSLIECACRVGAITGLADPGTVESCGRAGHSLGICAQITNDIRSLAPGAKGKSDLIRKKRTLPIVYGLQVAEGDDLALMEEAFLGGDRVSESLGPLLLEVLERLGAFRYCAVVADVYRQEALKTLSLAKIDMSVLGRMKELAS